MDNKIKQLKLLCKIHNLDIYKIKMNTKDKNNLPKKLGKLDQKRIEKKFDLLSELDEEIKSHKIKRSKSTNLYRVKKRLDEISDSLYFEFQIESFQ